MSKRLRSSYVCADCSGPGELHWPGPLPSAFLTRTPVPGPPLWVGRVPAAEPHTPCPTSRPGGTGAALGPQSSGPVRAGRTGGRRPPDPLVPLPSWSPLSQAERGGGGLRAPGWGHFFSRKGLGQSAGRPITEVKCKRPPDCGPQRLQVCVTLLSPPPLPRAPLREGALPGVGDLRHFPRWSPDAPKDP